MHKLTCEHCNKEVSFEIADIDNLSSLVASIREDGYDEGFEDAQSEQSDDIANDRRTAELRLSLYRAIYAGDLEAAKIEADLMAMVDIDRDLIWQAKGMERG